MAVEAFNRLRMPLVIVGDGPDARRLRRRAGPTISFAGRVSDAEVAGLMEGARAMVVTSVEEFGIAAVESQAAGRPVIAKRGGGALETVLDGVTGCLWSGGPEELASAVLRFDDAEIDPGACVRNALRFDSARFRQAMLSQISAGRATDFPPAGGDRQPLASTRLLRRAVRDPHGDRTNGDEH